MATDSKPQLPHGTPTTLGGLQETFAFHASPETFIASRMLAAQSEYPDLVKSRVPVRAKILNRNVAVVSSYTQIKHILTHKPDTEDNKRCPVFVAQGAYEQLMGPFYPRPNLLLADGDIHGRMRTYWEGLMKSLYTERLAEITKTEMLQHFKRSSNGAIDLYMDLKAVSWRVFLLVFLDLTDDDPVFGEVQHLQEELLRGQFSLFPVSVNLGWWQSPRKKGINAATKLQELLLTLLKKKNKQESPDEKLESDEDLRQRANHLLLFTSSLAVKGLASLLLPFLVNIFAFKSEDTTLHDRLKGCTPKEMNDLLRSILMETERLSPPIVGIMRRATCDTTLPASDSDTRQVLIPKGWDAWLYFAGGGRDPKTFGTDCDEFVPDRYLASESVPEGFAFSTGSKTCLGQRLVRGVCITAANALLDGGIRLEGNVDAPGVRRWLGWLSDGDVGLEDWARDMKQLPTQHPVDPLMMRVVQS